jgi:hypothetical protein
VVCDSRVALHRGGCRAAPGRTHDRPHRGESAAIGERHWEGRPQGVKVPYPKSQNAAVWERHLSTTGHEKPCRNPGGPPSKATYTTATDSAAVP